MKSSLPYIVVLDDDALTLEALRSALGALARVYGFSSPTAAEAWIGRNRPAVALIDLNLQGFDGLEVLSAWRAKFPEMECVVCSGEVRLERAVECMRHGASDYLVKPLRREELVTVMRRALGRNALRHKAESLQTLVRPQPAQLVGESAAMQELRAKIARLKGEALNVLILGESGTGKEVVARLLHQQEEDEERPFVVANMPAIPASLMEAELFGVEKGAFTDAKAARAGKFELADGGDIFLDEIGDLPFETQAKLLRTLQEHELERLGSSVPRRVEFRVLAATNQPLADLIARGRFRGDLMYRLSDIILRVPPLRERPDDIVPLAAHFIAKYTPPSLSRPELSPRAVQTLEAYDWPGNVRQLESTIKRALVLGGGSVLLDIEIDDPARGKLSDASTAQDSLSRHLALEEKSAIENALRRNRGSRTAAMRELKLSRATFYRRVQALGILL